MKTIETTVEAALIKRIITTCVRENLLAYKIENNQLQVELTKSKMMLILDNVQQLPLSNHQNNGDVFYLVEQ